jgi:uncharacterized protein (DUF488 family)
MTDHDGKPLVVFTIGHSTRSIGDFVALLKSNGISVVVDVRTIPKSRHNPQFSLDALPGSLAGDGIGYVHLSGLGGLRHARRDSINTAWRNASFRGFADYMQTPEFKAALDQLIDLAQHQVVAVMCAEAVPWRCHRSLIADALLVRKVHVLEIIGTADAKAHALTPWAKVNGAEITYPSIAALSDPLGRRR